MFEIEQLVLVILILGFILINIKTKVGFYRILSAVLSLYFAFSVGNDIFLFVIFTGLSLFLFISTFVSGE